MKLVRAVEDRRLASELAARGAYQRRNFAAACTAARAFLGRDLDREAVLDAAHSVIVPGRFEVHDGAPQVLFDGAHNPGGIEALTASLPEFVAGRRLVAVVSILDDKDAASMLRGLLAHVDALVCTAAASPRALPAATLASLAGQLGAGEVLDRAAPARSDASRARARGRDGSGSRDRVDLPARRAPARTGILGADVDDLMWDETPNLVAMIAVVAIVVIVVILVFAAIGYGFGRLVL